MNRMIEKCKRKRKCHQCYTSIQKGEDHLAIYSASRFGWWSVRSNICFICLEIVIRKIKKSIKGGIKDRRNRRLTEMLVEEL